MVRLPRKRAKPWRVLRTIRTIWCLGKDADVLFVNELTFESVVANTALRKPLVMKVVGDLAWERAMNWGWTVDDFETFQKRRYGLRIELFKALRSWRTRRAGRIIVPSRYLARWVAGWGVSEDKLVVIYNAAELVDGVEPLPVPLTTPVKAVTVGRLVQWKRVDGLLEALKEVPGLGLVVGDGPERPRLERLARELQVSDQVYFAGQRSKKEALGLMAACDLFLLNSTYEGPPRGAGGDGPVPSRGGYVGGRDARGGAGWGNRCAGPSRKRDAGKGVVCLRGGRGGKATAGGESTEMGT